MDLCEDASTDGSTMDVVDLVSPADPQNPID